MTKIDRHRGGALAGWAARAAHLPELMDDPQCDQGALHRTFRAFVPVNRLLSGWATLYRRQLRPLLRERGGGTLLDIGCGGGDVGRALTSWAARDGLVLRVTGIDADARVIAFAQAQPTTTARFRHVLSSDLRTHAEQYDLVISNHLLHHLSAPELTALLDDSAHLCTGLALHNDIHRHPLAYAAFKVGTAWAFPGSFIHEDGLRSIRRSYTPGELAQVVPPGWVVRTQAPFRLLAQWEAPGG